jgi:hypothetical protein
MNNLICAITNGRTDPLEQLYELLLARGFLVEYLPNGIGLSDNSVPKLDFEGLMRVSGDLLKHDDNLLYGLADQAEISDVYNRLFTGMTYIGFETCCYTNVDEIKEFRRQGFSQKVATTELEAYVSIYVKALSSLKIETIMSCNGHFDERRGIHSPMWVELLNHYNCIFHRLLYKKEIYLMNSGLRWHNRLGKLVLPLPVDRVNALYANVINCGKYIYSSRVRLREYRQILVDNLTKEDYELSDDDLFERMTTLLQ